MGSSPAARAWQPAAAITTTAAAGCQARAAGDDPIRRQITIHYSHYSMSEIDVPAGVPITFTIRNDDPIDHEWMIGDMAMHERHRLGTEPVHTSRPDEVTIPAPEADAEAS